jgi:hypothetical protein
VAFVFQGIAREIAGTLAQINRLMALDFTGFAFIAEQVREDSRQARAELDAFERRVLGLAGPVTMPSGAATGMPSAPPAPTVGGQQAFEAAKKERERLKTQIDTFYAKDGETLAMLFVQHTGIALKEAFMYGNGKSARIALYDKEANHFGIYSYKPNAKGERALLTVPNLAYCKYSFEVAKKLREFFKECKKISE